MCVDYASKYRDHAGDKWAIRNVKLRMSRKLIFASGLLTCYSCDRALISLEDHELSKTPTVEGLVQRLTILVGQTPLDILAGFLAKYGDPVVAASMFDAYDAFLGILNDGSTRAHLETLRPEAGATDAMFRAIQHLTKEFEVGLD